MIQKKKLWVSPESQLRALGWNWMLSQDTKNYITEEVLLIKQSEGEAFYEAANQLYEMLLQTADYVLENDLLAQTAIPESLWEIIRFSWQDDAQIPLYGRFDLAGGLDGKPISFIEYNADTAVCVAETAVVQWSQLKANKLNESYQFNYLFEALTETWRKILAANPQKPPTLLLSYLEGYPEDQTTVSVIGQAAQEAGFKVTYSYLHETEFGDDGIYTSQEGFFVKHNFWFKLVPWHWIAVDEPELLEILKKIVLGRHAVILNPPYSVLLESKALLKFMYDLFPESPFVLKTDFEPLSEKQVRKPILGREGANVAICDQNAKTISQTEGDYAKMPSVYQKYTNFLKDEEGFYQAGVFVSQEACGLGFRCGKEIIDDYARFLGHIID